jgi:hypothetical protein
MASRNQLKQWFSTGKKPTQGQFAELIESFFHKAEDTITIALVQNLSQVLADKVSQADLNLISSVIGNIGDLQTNAKENIISALNELVSHDDGLTLLLNDILARLNGITEDLAGGRFIEATEKGMPDGIATLDINGKIPATQIPFSDTDVVHLSGNETIAGNKIFSNPVILNKGFTIQVSASPPPPSINNFSVYATEFDSVPSQGIAIHNGNEAKKIILSYKGLTDNRFYLFPDKTGMIALTTDIPISEEGTWVPTWHEYSSSNYQFKRIDSAVYARVGKIVTLNLECIIERIALTNSNHSISIGGLPFRCKVFGAINYATGGANNYAPRFGVTLDTHLRFHEEAFEGMTSPIGATFWIRSTLTYIML